METHTIDHTDLNCKFSLLISWPCDNSCSINLPFTPSMCRDHPDVGRLAMNPNPSHWGGGYKIFRVGGLWRVSKGGSQTPLFLGFPQRDGHRDEVIRYRA